MSDNPTKPKRDWTAEEDKAMREFYPHVSTSKLARHKTANTQTSSPERARQRRKREGKWNRVVVWFSCGAASACAAKLALEQFGAFRPVEVVYCDTRPNEHPDNSRFLADVERWIGKKITILPLGKYKTVDEVIEGERYMAGVAGARCTVELKKIPRFQYQDPYDLQLYGYTIEEGKRIVKFTNNNPELNLLWILAAHGMTKEDCKRMVQKAGIELPKMYQLGFNNNNCIGCLKAESLAYWATTKHYFPEVFDKRCRQGRSLGVKQLKIGGKRYFLDELPETPLLPIITEDISCGPHCGIEKRSDL